jgi:hypothetical protein
MIKDRITCLNINARIIASNGGIILSNPGITLTDCVGTTIPSSEMMNVPVSGIFISALKLPPLTSVINSSVTTSPLTKIFTEFIESGNSEPEILNSIFSRAIPGTSITCALNCGVSKKRNSGRNEKPFSL